MSSPLRTLLFIGFVVGLCLTVVAGTVLAIVLFAPPAPPPPRKSDMTLAAFLVQRPAEGAVIRADCKLRPSDSEVWYVVSVDDGSASKYVGVKIISREGQYLFAKLSDGRSHRLTVRLLPATHPNSMRYDDITITEILSD